MAAADRILQAPGVTVLESHFAGWQRPWRALSDSDRAELRRGPARGLPWIEVETGRDRGPAVRYGLEIVPQLLVLLDGAVLTRFRGRSTARDLDRALRAALARGREIRAWRAGRRGGGGNAGDGRLFATLRAP